MRELAEVERHIPLQAAEDRARGWQADLQLRFATRNGRTYLAEREHRGPLVVQRSFYPEADVCHTYIVHPPGGVVGGDELRLGLRADAGAQVVMTTPAATKFYRSSGAFASATQELRLSNATLEWLPQESIYFCDARVRNKTIVRIDASSKFIGWEIPCFGLPARGERFERGVLKLDLELWRDDHPLLIDRLRIDGEHAALAARWGLAGFTAMGTLIAWPAQRREVEALRALESNDCEWAVTVVDGVLVARAFALQAEPIKRTFIAAWQALRPLLLGRAAVLPRIWAT